MEVGVTVHPRQAVRVRLVPLQGIDARQRDRRVPVAAGAARRQLVEQVKPDHCGRKRHRRVRSKDFYMYWTSVSSISQCYMFWNHSQRHIYFRLPEKRKWLTPRSRTNASIYRVTKHATAHLYCSRSSTTLAFRRYSAG